jgi:hypothetical protein
MRNSITRLRSTGMLWPTLESWSDVRHLTDTAMGATVGRVMDVNTRRRLWIVVAGGFMALFGVLLLTNGGESEADEQGHAAPDSTTSVAAPIDAVPADPGSVYDPVKAGEPTPSSYRQLLGRDQIEPIYEPSFTSADGVDWSGEVLIVGVEGAKTTKAYPVSHLNRREMVIDHIDGDPILVSW